MKVFLKKTVVLITIGFVVFLLDHLSKSWANKNLATYSHPLPAVVTTADSGKNLLDFVKEKFPYFSDSEWNQYIKYIEVTKEGFKIAPEDNLYGKKYRNIIGFYVFHKKDLNFPPRKIVFKRIVNGSDVFLYKDGIKVLLQYLGADFSKLKEFFSIFTVKELLLEELPSVDEDEIDIIITSYTYPIYAASPQLSLSQKVKKGEIYFLTNRKVDVIKGFLRFIYVENPNGSWGFLRGVPSHIKDFVLNFVSSGAILIILIMFYTIKFEDKFLLYTFAVIFGGAVGNVPERFLNGFVIDFIDMYIGKNHWPTYNIADIAITCGIILLLIDSIIKSKKQSSSKNK